jgi:hypothetical protein
MTGDDHRGSVHVEAMWSMARYKQRDPSRYDHVPMESIPEFMKQTFETIEQLVDMRPGFIVDFGHLHVDAALARLFDFIDPTIDETHVADLVRRAQRATKRDTRLERQARPFLGVREGSSTVDVGDPDGAWSGTRSYIDACVANYERLLSSQASE